MRKARVDHGAENGSVELLPVFPAQWASALLRGFEIGIDDQVDLSRASLETGTPDEHKAESAD
jgi:hypothetical protein